MTLRQKKVVRLFGAWKSLEAASDEAERVYLKEFTRLTEEEITPELIKATNELGR